MKAMPVIQTAVPAGGAPSPAGIGNAEAAAGSPSEFAGALKAAVGKPGRRSGAAKQPDDGAAGGNVPPAGNQPPPIAMVPASAAGKPSMAPRGVGGTGAVEGFTGATAATAALDGSVAIDGKGAARVGADAAGNAGNAGAAGEPLSTLAWAASGVSAETLSAAAVPAGTGSLGRGAVAAATRGTTPAKAPQGQSGTPARGRTVDTTRPAPSVSVGAITSGNGDAPLSAPAAPVPNDPTAGDEAGVAASVIDVAGATWAVNFTKSIGANSHDGTAPTGAMQGPAGTGVEAGKDALTSAAMPERRSEMRPGATNPGGISGPGPPNPSNAPIGVDGINGVPDAKHGHAGSELGAPAGGGDAAAGMAPLNASAAPPTTAAAPVLRVHASVGSEEFAQGLSDRVSWMIDNGVNGAKLQVNPPQLGPIELRISVQGDHAQVWMSTHSAVARDALESNSPRLREMLNDQGFSQVSVDISQRSFQDRAAYAPPYQREPVDERSDAVKPVAAAMTAAAMPRNGIAGLDAYA